MCRALCAVEMLSLQNNGLPEFTGTCPTLPEVSPRFMLFNALGMSVIGLEAKQECDRLGNQWDNRQMYTATSMKQVEDWPSLYHNIKCWMDSLSSKQLKRLHREQDCRAIITFVKLLSSHGWYLKDNWIDITLTNTSFGSVGFVYVRAVFN